MTRRIYLKVENLNKYFLNIEEPQCQRQGKIQMNLILICFPVCVYLWLYFDQLVSLRSHLTVQVVTRDRQHRYSNPTVNRRPDVPNKLTSFKIISSQNSTIVLVKLQTTSVLYYTVYCRPTTTLYLVCLQEFLFLVLSLKRLSPIAFIGHG